MYKTVEEHGTRLDEHGNTLENYGQRIVVLEKSDAEKTEVLEYVQQKMDGIKTDFTNLENTIWKTTQSTQDMMVSQNTQQWKLIESLNENKEKERERKHELKKTKLERFWEWLGKATVGSGVFIVALELLFGR